VGEITDSLIYW